MAVFYLNAAAQHPEQVGDDLAFEDFGIVGLQAVEDFAAHRHDPLKLTVPGQLNAAQGRVALHDIELPSAGIPSAAIHELGHPVGDIHGAGELLLDVEAGLLGVLPGPLVDQYLVGDLLGVDGVLDEIDAQLFFQEVGHGLLDKFVVDGLLGLVLIGGLGGEIVGDQDQRILNILEGDLALVLIVLALLL